VKRYVPQLAAAIGIQDRALLEKDIRLHALLQHLMQESSIHEHLVFKGGTCLIKCHLDYPRFSVDLDFTWRGGADWLDLGPKQARNATRQARDAWRQSLAEDAAVVGYRFDDAQIEWGSSSRMGTAYLHYDAITGEPALIKLQVNFVEPRVRDYATRDAHTLISRDVPLAAELLDGPGLDAYRAPFPVTCYEAEEIAAEKVRAILTRRAPKGRDVLDLFLLESELGVHVEDLEDEIRTKLDFALGLGEKYNLNLDDAPRRLRILADQDIQGLLLKDVDAEAFGAYRSSLLEYVRRFIP
jgi:predicted nucleotidyltransferase component of viral defense system